MAVNYVSTDQQKAVLFAYDVYPRFEEKLFPVKLQGLDPNKMYKVEEINLMLGVKSVLKDQWKGPFRRLSDESGNQCFHNKSGFQPRN